MEYLTIKLPLDDIKLITSRLNEKAALGWSIVPGSLFQAGREVICVLQRPQTPSVMKHTTIKENKVIDLGLDEIK